MKYCTYCGKENQDDSKYCYNCGKPFNYDFAVNSPQKPTSSKNGYAIAGFVLSFFFPLLGLIFGALGYSRSKEMSGKGKQFSVAAMVISLVMVVGSAIAGFIFRFIGFDLYY